MLTVGRRESCDICLQFQNVSSRHCEFVYANGHWTVKDLGSSNGVKVNGGERLTPQTARLLKPGHRAVDRDMRDPEATGQIHHAGLPL